MALYLKRLDDELEGVPERLRREILAGVSEELNGVDAATAASRIEELGDPAFIAAEAREGIDAPPPARPASDWQAIVAVVLIIFGGFVIPVVGWIAGIAVMWSSSRWRRWEKWVVTVAPLAAAVLTNLVLGVVARVQGETGESPFTVFGIPLVLGGVSPLTVAMVLIGATVLSGFWLLVRARRPRPRP